LIEVTAAIESPAMVDPHAQLEPVAKLPKTSKEPAVKRAVAAYRSVEKSESPSDDRRSQPVIGPLEAELNQLRDTVAEQNVGQLQRELSELKTLVQQLAEARSAVPAPVPSVAPVTRVEVREVQPASAMIRQALLARGIDDEAAETIARFADSRMGAEQRRDPQLQHQFLRDTIADLVQVSEPIWGAEVEGPRRIALIGPTGVGKTTTIAKLAAAALAAGSRVALVTIDTFRIAAVEQLKVYGEIMNLPVEVIFRPDQLPQILRQHRDKDLILIDTAGRSPRDRSRIEELSEFLGKDSGIENWLVLPAHGREEQLQQVVKNFSQVVISSLVFTKLDECESWGTLINLPTRTALPLACLTNGQQVPEDLLLAEPQMVADWVMGSEPQAQKDVV
ncbi:MAG: flagellar biosynthesis protein FlhF, partial [Geopsychrobacter sp.]|nr:flagellar biosynthesis protein FlhF [Geopsychrobacter sp.]